MCWYSFSSGFSLDYRIVLCLSEYKQELSRFASVVLLLISAGLILNFVLFIICHRFSVLVCDE